MKQNRYKTALYNSKAATAAKDAQNNKDIEKAVEDTKRVHQREAIRKFIKSR